MIFRKRAALVFPAAFLCTSLSYSAFGNDTAIFGCSSLFGNTGQKTWLVGLDLKQGNLLTTRLTTNRVSAAGLNFGASTVHIRNHIIGPPDKSEQISAGDSLTFCKNLDVSVGSQLQLHWQGQSTPQVFVVGGGLPQLGCLYGHINDPFSGSVNPFLACVSQGSQQSTAYELISVAFKKMSTPQAKEWFCDKAAKESNVNFSVCAGTFDSLPVLYPDFAAYLNQTIPH